MTIAACYLSSEGVVFGADSSTTMYVEYPSPDAGGVEHHFNYAQKIFQIGRESNLGITMWGLGSLASVSYRTLLAGFGDVLESEPPSTMEDIADRWSDFFWAAYSSDFASILARVGVLESAPVRTAEEEQELNFLLEAYSGGFCIGGRCAPDRTPKAFEITYLPRHADGRSTEPLSVGNARFWGCPNLIQRLVAGIDFGLLADIENSGKWNGTSEELMQLIIPHRLAQPVDLPIREAIEWIHASISTTIQAMKFSHLAPICGGPIELSVITTDRPFRWVRHKRLDAALQHGKGNDA
jgi:hypothetical protein